MSLLTRLSTVVHWEPNPTELFKLNFTVKPGTQSIDNDVNIGGHNLILHIYIFRHYFRVSWVINVDDPYSRFVRKEEPSGVSRVE